MKRWILTVSVAFLLCGTAEASVGGMVHNVWTYLTGFVTCGIARAGALVDWAVDSATCALKTVNKNPTTLDPLVTVIPHEGGTP